MKSIKLPNRSPLIGWRFAVLFMLGASRLPAADVEQWGVWETKFEGPRESNPYVDVQLTPQLVLQDWNP